ncbi:MAG: NAD(P)-dependent oxidoreductase [Rhizobiales bacterium]|nr:NAD(P)-dependent oxidoreductase [Hyphomicrobiales bacterium]
MPSPLRLLITGNQGYIGPIATRLARMLGHSVVGLDVGYFQTDAIDNKGASSPDRQILRDIRDVQPGDLDGIDAIIHLAGLSNDPMGELNPQLTHDINLNSTVRLGTIAKECGISRFVFASSCSIYGAAGNTDALDESAPFNPVSAYAVSKVSSEEGLLALADQNFSPVFMRNATAFGVSPRMRFDLVLNNLMGWAFTTNVIKVMSDGTPWRPLVHIEDISRAAIAAATAPREAVHAQAFNIGRSDANYRVRDIAEAVGKQFPTAKVEITGETGGDSRSYRVNFDKATNNLPGFEARWTLEKGVEEIAQWLAAGRLKNSSFDSRLFIRLKQIKHLIDQGEINDQLRFV